MKVITNLTAGTVADQAGEVVSAVMAVCDEPVNGLLRKVMLNGDGLTVQRPVTSGAVIQVRIPLAELLRLAEAVEPLLRPSVAGRKTAREN